MVFAEVLQSVGAPGWIVILAMVGLGLYHFTSLLDVLSRVGLVLRIVAVFVAIGVVAMLGLIPGVDIDVMIVPETIFGVLEAIWAAVQQIVPLSGAGLA